MSFSLNIFILIEYFVLSVQTYDTSTLKLLQIVHRHADRTPISFPSNDKYKGISNWPDGYGQLTPKGKQRMYDLGKEYRKRYSNYLGTSPKEVYSRSSAADRCLESAQSLIAGMYQPKGRWVWSNESNNNIATLWQPIPIQTVLKKTDGLLSPTADCPTAKSEYLNIMNSQNVQRFLYANKEFMNKVNEKIGEKYTTLKQMDYLADTINVEIENGFAPPEWLNVIGNDTLKKLYEFRLKAFEWDYSTPTIHRLRAGLLLQELTFNMKNASDPNKNNNMPKLYLYSTHDSNLVVILQSLGIYTGVPPSYGTSLLFELHQINKEYILKLFYANVAPVYQEPYQLNLTICSQFKSSCELNLWSNSIKKLIPTDWAKECGLTNVNVNAKSFLAEAGPIAIGFAIGMGVMILLLMVGYCCIKRTNKRIYRPNDYDNELKRRR